MIEMPTAIDLFCGAGGLSTGLSKAGFRLTAAFDAWSPAVASYRLNHPGHPCWKTDVASLGRLEFSKLGLPRPDLVAGGPPCQGFSAQRIGSDDDERNDLVLAFGRFVVATQARTFLMENVRGLLGSRGKITVSRFLNEMEAAGYTVEKAVLDAVDFGVPQNRQRVFFFGRLSDLEISFAWPTPTFNRPISVAAALDGLEEPPHDGTCSPSDPLHRRSRLSPLNQRRLALIPPGGGFEDLPIEMRVDCHKGGAARIGHRAVYGRLHPDRPASTITGRFDSFTRGRFAHPTIDRNITLREGARLQGFPDSHLFLGSQEEIAAQIGNAVPPPLAAAVGRAIFESLHAATRKCKPAKKEKTTSEGRHFRDAAE